MKLHKTYIASFLVGISLMIGAGLVYINQRNTQPSSAAIYADAPVGTAVIAVTPKESSTIVGQQVQVTVTLDTKGEATSGVDLYMKYDPKLLEVVDADPAGANVQIAKGTLFDFSPANLVNLSSGKISFSASQQPTSAGVSGTGTVATITFKAKSAGTAQIGFDFTPGSLRDTNVIKKSDGRDLLNDVQDATIKIAR
jgi:hypothetical protein